MWFIIMMYWAMHGFCWEPDDDHVLAYGTVEFAGQFKDGLTCFKMEIRWTNGKWLQNHLKPF